MDERRESKAPAALAGSESRSPSSFHYLAAALMGVVVVAFIAAVFVQPLHCTIVFGNYEPVVAFFVAAIAAVASAFELFQRPASRLLGWFLAGMAVASVGVLLVMVFLPSPVPEECFPPMPPMAITTIVLTQTTIPTPGFTPESTLVTTVTPVCTVYPTATAIPVVTLRPSVTATAPPTSTASSSPVATPQPRPTAKLSPQRATPPEPVAPAQGETYKNPITFAWRGSLRGSQAYRVTARHTERDYVIQSELLTDPSWTTDLPVKGDTDGEWRWTVSVVLYGRTLVTSSEWMFWFRPFGAAEPDNGDQEPTNTPPP